MVKTILKQERVEIPDNVKLSLKSKVVTVEGPKGTIAKTFRNVPVQISEVRNEAKKLVALNVRVWFSKSKAKSCVTTICKHISNMITGVTKGFCYTMKYGYRILPMQPVAIDEGRAIQIVNYIGDKYVRKIKAYPGVTIRTTDIENKKDIEILGIDPNAVGITCSRISQACRSKGVDRRVFSDGVYIYNRGFQS